MVLLLGSKESTEDNVDYDIPNLFSRRKID